MALVLTAEHTTTDVVSDVEGTATAAATENATAAQTIEATDRQDKFLRVDSAHHHGPRLVIFQLGRNRLALPERADDDRRQIADRLADVAETFDLAEPFQRIRAAIEEAQQALR